MTGKIQFLFASSFLMGMFAGAYFYVTFFAPAYDNDDKDILSQETFVIEGEMYGGCQRSDSCASFQLIDARKYSFSDGIDTQRSDGTLPSSVRKALQNALTEDTLVNASEPITNRSCAAYTDGIDYRYMVRMDGISYELDTCTTALAYDKALQDIFIDVWFVMANPDAVEDEPFKLDLQQLFYDRFNNVSN